MIDSLVPSIRQHVLQGLPSPHVPNFRFIGIALFWVVIVCPLLLASLRSSLCETGCRRTILSFPPPDFSNCLHPAPPQCHPQYSISCERFVVSSITNSSFCLYTSRWYRLRQQSHGLYSISLGGLSLRSNSLIFAIAIQVCHAG
jgi:hypothetical protein